VILKVVWTLGAEFIVGFLVGWATVFALMLDVTAVQTMLCYEAEMLAGY
jgi:hypothetical protein